MGANLVGQPLWNTLLACALLLSSLVNGAENETARALFLAIGERLAYMEDVALYKAQNHISVEDIEREVVVVENAKLLAVTHGLNAESMELFFLAQIDAAKAIQYRYRAEALTRGLPGRSVDLNSAIRPALDRLGSEIVRLFAEFLREGNTLDENYRESFTAALSSPHLSAADKDALFDSMRQVRLGQ